MQTSEAARLAKAWEAKGNPPCDHPTAAEEFYLGSRTGDMVCKTCGHDMQKDEWRALQASRKEPS